MKETKTMMKKEVDFFKKKGAPKSMVKHEEAEMKSTKKEAKPAKKAFYKGGSVDGCVKKGRTKGTMIKMSGSK